jgi:hypothetical protein
VQIQNNSGSAITGFTISYIGEQWRLGATFREDRMDFQFSTDATGLAAGTWTDVNALDFVAPIISPPTGPLDGNASPNRVSINGTIGGISVANGSTIWFRWTDFNAAGSDDGLAIDDFSLTAVPEPAEWGLLSALSLLGVAGFHSRRQSRHLESTSDR